jgi:uncharacterized membrane protein YedE/YeeE
VQIDWTAFTPLTAIAGGVLIGLSAALLVLVNGRIAGISGIVGGLARAHAGDRAWRIAFVAGLVAAPLVMLATPLHLSADVDASYPVLVVAGVLVGIGTRYGGGCTSGHGVCGVSRLSPRSMVATAVFIGVGIGVVYVVRHAMG